MTSTGEEPGEDAVFVSPHLDDAVLSSGALIRTLAHSGPVLVVTVFTECGAGPHTRAARNFVAHTPIPDAEQLFEQRRREDLVAIEHLGARALHLGYTDALFRKREGNRFRMLGRHVPELTHLYPTYRWDIARGRIHRTDRSLIDDLSGELARLFEAVRPRAVFAPIGLGLHTDHLIVREAVLAAAPGATLWADQPYLHRGQREPDAGLAASRDSWTWTGDLEAKGGAVELYATQVPALFSHGRVPVLEERYFGPRPAGL